MKIEVWNKHNGMDETIKADDMLLDVNKEFIKPGFDARAVAEEFFKVFTPREPLIENDDIVSRGGEWNGDLTTPENGGGEDNSFRSEVKSNPEITTPAVIPEIDCEEETPKTITRRPHNKISNGKVVHSDVELGLTLWSKYGKIKIHMEPLKKVLMVKANEGLPVRCTNLDLVDIMEETYLDYSENSHLKEATSYLKYLETKGRARRLKLGKGHGRRHVYEIFDRSLPKSDNPNIGYSDDGLEIFVPEFINENEFQTITSIKPAPPFPPYERKMKSGDSPAEA